MKVRWHNGDGRWSSWHPGDWWTFIALSAARPGRTVHLAAPLLYESFDLNEDYA